MIMVPQRFLLLSFGILLVWFEMTMSFDEEFFTVETSESDTSEWVYHNFSKTKLDEGIGEENNYTLPDNDTSSVYSTVGKNASHVATEEVSTDLHKSLSIHSSSSSIPSESPASVAPSNGSSSTEATEVEYWTSTVTAETTTSHVDEDTSEKIHAGMFTTSTGAFNSIAYTISAIALIVVHVAAGYLIYRLAKRRRELRYRTLNDFP